MRHVRRMIAVAAALAALGGCATSGTPPAADPFEPLNRAAFAFNEPLDRDVVKPIVARNIPTMLTNNETSRTPSGATGRRSPRNAAAATASNASRPPVNSH